MPAEGDPQTLTRRLVRAGLLTSVLEAAIEVARKGESDDPPVAAPGALRPVLQFRKMPATARNTIASVLLSDDDFRERVAASVDPGRIGRVASLWLNRGPNWIGELAPFVDGGDDGGMGSRPDEPDLRTLQRKLSGAERAARRAGERVTDLEADAAKARDQAITARAELRALQRERDSARRRIAELDAEVAELRRTIEAADRHSARRDDERRRLQARVRELEEAAGLGPSPRDASEIQRLSRAVLGALRAATADAEALDRELSIRLARTPRPVRAVPGRAARRPVKMPGGIVDDSVAGAEHLVTRSQAVLIIDGYNVTLTAWPELRLDQGRERLVSLLDELTARVKGLECHVVFDGSDVVGPARRRRPGAVHVRFTEQGVEADDVVLAVADELPLTRPVIVASNDRQVRDGARERGANVISVQQLLALAR